MDSTIFDVGSIRNFLQYTTRPSTDEYFIAMAILAASRGTCSRRKVGCVLTNKHHHVIATGYNGVAAGLPHCWEKPCPGAGLPSGQGLTSCEALHAEENALMQCRDIFSIHTCYTTASPCVNCLRKLLGTSCERIVFLEEYPHPESKKMWIEAGRSWIQIHSKVTEKS